MYRRVAYDEDGVTVVRNGMTEQQEERLREAVRGWLSAADELTAAQADGEEAAVLMELAERATLARLLFHRTLTDLGWTPPPRDPR